MTLTAHFVLSNLSTCDNIVQMLQNNLGKQSFNVAQWLHADKIIESDSTDTLNMWASKHTFPVSVFSFWNSMAKT